MSIFDQLSDILTTRKEYITYQSIVNTRDDKHVLTTIIHALDNGTLRKDLLNDIYISSKIKYYTSTGLERSYNFLELPDFMCKGLNLQQMNQIAHEANHLHNGVHLEFTKMKFNQDLKNPKFHIYFNIYHEHH